MDNLDLGSLKCRGDAEGLVKRSPTRQQTEFYQFRYLVRVVSASLLALPTKARRGVLEEGRQRKVKPRQRYPRQICDSRVVRKMQHEYRRDRVVLFVYVDIQVGKPQLFGQYAIPCLYCLQQVEIRRLCTPYFNCEMRGTVDPFTRLARRREERFRGGSSVLTLVSGI